MDATALYSVIMVFQKTTAFPLKRHRKALEQESVFLGVFCDCGDASVDLFVSALSPSHTTHQLFPWQRVRTWQRDCVLLIIQRILDGLLCVPLLSVGCHNCVVVVLAMRDSACVRYCQIPCHRLSSCSGQKSCHTKPLAVVQHQTGWFLDCRHQVPTR